MEEDGNLGFNIRVYTYTNINCFILIILVSMLKQGEKKEISLPMAGAGKGGATSGRTGVGDEASVPAAFSGDSHDPTTETAER